MSPTAPLRSVGDFRWSCELEVRFRDVDAMGHVNNAAYLTYFEVARTGYMRALGHVEGPRPAMADWFPFIVAQLSCRFLAPATVGDRLRVHLRTSKLGRKSFDFDYLAVQAADQSPVAAGQSTQVYYDYREQRTKLIPADFRQRIEKLEGRSLSEG